MGHFEVYFVFWTYVSSCEPGQDDQLPYWKKHFRGKCESKRLWILFIWLSRPWPYSFKQKVFYDLINQKLQFYIMRYGIAVIDIFFRPKSLHFSISEGHMIIMSWWILIEVSGFVDHTAWNGNKSWFWSAWHKKNQLYYTTCISFYSVVYSGIDWNAFLDFLRKLERYSDLQLSSITSSFWSVPA